MALSNYGTQINDYLFKGRGGHEQTYHEEVEFCPPVKQRLVNARRVTG